MLIALGLKLKPDLPEAGYTPANLRALLASAGLTQQAAADLLGVSAVSMRRWLMPPDTDSHRDMPLMQWLRLLEIAQ